MLRKNIVRGITLGLVLGTSLMGAVAHANTPITDGTHSVGGDVILNNNYVNSDTNSNVVINITDDTKFTQQTLNHVVFFIGNGTNNSNVLVNGNNKDITFDGNGRGLYLGNGTDNHININNVNNFTASNTENNTNMIYMAGSNNELSIDVNHDINIINYATGYPTIYADGSNSTLNLYAGHNINLSGVSNMIRILGSTTLNVATDNDIILNSMYTNTSPISLEAGAVGNVTAKHNLILNGVGNPTNVKGGSKGTFIAGNDFIATSSGTYSGFAVTGSGSIGIYEAQNGNFIMESTGGNTSSFYVATNATAKVTAAKDVKIGGNAQRGLRVVSDAILDITAGDGHTIDISATNTSAGNNAGIYTEGTSSIVYLHSPTNITAITDGIDANNGTVTFDKDLSISGAETAIKVRSGGVVNATDPDSAKKITGNILADGAGSAANLVLNTADSYITGSSARTSGGIISLNMKKKALWNVTADSSLSDLDMADATINMRYTGNSTNETLTADNLTGNGNFIMNTDLQSSFDSKDVTMNGDKIVITTSSSGDNILDLRDISLDTGKLAEGYLLLVEDQSNGAATFSGKDLDHGGIFRYKPVIVTDNPTDYTGFNPAAKNWYLTGFEKTVAVSDNTNVTLGMADTRYANYLMDTDTLLKRLGELRMLKAEEDRDGLWARYRHGGMNGEKFDGSFSTFQIGYDKKTSQKRYTGLAYSHTSNSFDLNAGKGEGSMDAISVYNTWLGDKNHYFDIVGKIGRMRGNSTYQDALFPEKGESESKFYSLSGEYGRKNINKDGYYYEPQAQLTLGRISGDDYTTSRGTKVSAKSITSLLGRAGVTIGKEFNMDNPAKHSNVYGKINYMHEFKGDSTTNLTDAYGDSFGPTTEFGGSWWNLGIGTTVNLNKETHLYVDLEKNFGGEVKTNWLMQAGVRWTW